MSTKIVYCINTLSLSGGTERVVTTKMNYLCEIMGYEVHVVLRNNNRKTFFPLSSLVIVHYLNISSQKDYCNKLTKLLIEIQPDFTISTGGREYSFLYKINDGSNKILEFHFTKNYLINFVKGIKNIRFRKLHLLKVWYLQKRLAHYIPKYDKVVLLTKRDLILWGNKPNMCYIYNPLSFRSKIYSTKIFKRIIAIGSLTPAKGMDLLIDAFGIIAHQFPEWEVVIFGSGQDYNLLLELIKKHHIEKQVKIYPPTINIANELCNSSIYAFPSRSDGFGLVLTEAMECGLPSVAFDCECGPREILSSNSGFLIEKENTVLFAGALKELITDENLRKQMGSNARKEVARFYPENIMPKWIKLFDEMIKNN